MILDLNNYTLPLDNIDLARVLNAWTWLIGNDKQIIALTKSGDALLKDNANKLYFLNVGGGTIELIADNYQDFLNNKLTFDIIEELLLPNLVDRLEACDIKLRPGQVYSYRQQPILGGKYDETNMFAFDLYEHFELSADIHYQLKDTPDGTQVDIVTE